MAYIATYATARGFNVGVLDAEAHGLPIADVVSLNGLAPRWAGFNLLAPTYEVTEHIADRLDHRILIMAGGHHAKAMPARILADPRMRRCSALILGEAETRVAELLADDRPGPGCPASCGSAPTAVLSPVPMRPGLTWHRTSTRSASIARSSRRTRTPLAAGSRRAWWVRAAAP